MIYEAASLVVVIKLYFFKKNKSKRSIALCSVVIGRQPPQFQIIQFVKNLMQVFFIGISLAFLSFPPLTAPVCCQPTELIDLGFFVA